MYYDPLKVNRAISIQLSKIEDRGIKLEIGYDFSYFKKVAIKKYGRIGSLFDPDFFRFTPENAFYMLGKDEEGNIIHTQAARLDVLYGETLADFLIFEFPRIYNVPLRESQLSILNEMSGKFCYHGDMWFDKNEKKGIHTSGHLGKLFSYLILTRWIPDYSYGFMEKRLACTGFGHKEGYYFSKPDGIKWDGLPPSPYVSSDYFLWMTKEDLIESAYSTLEEYTK